MIKEEVKIVEVGPRDGLQNEKVILPIETKIELIDLLVDAGFKTIEPTSFVRPEYIPQMADSKTLFSSILKHVHKGTIETVYTLLDGEYEFIEEKYKCYDR